MADLLRERAMTDVRVFVGGIIPAQDLEALREIGVLDVFPPGTSTEEVVRRIRSAVQARREPEPR